MMRVKDEEALLRWKAKLLAAIMDPAGFQSLYGAKLRRRAPRPVTGNGPGADMMRFQREQRERQRCRQAEPPRVK